MVVGSRDGDREAWETGHQAVNVLRVCAVFAEKLKIGTFLLKEKLTLAFLRFAKGKVGFP